MKKIPRKKSKSAASLPIRLAVQKLKTRFAPRKSQPKNEIVSKAHYPVRPISVQSPVNPHVFINPSVEFELPAQYGQNKLVLLVRDPWWVYAYWEVTDSKRREGD